MYKKQYLRSVFFFVALSLLATGCFGKKVQEAKIDKQAVGSKMETIKIGVIAPMSGDAAAYGEQTQRVLSYQLEKINQKNQTKGKKFELIYEDGKCDGGNAVSAFQKLKNIDNVSFVIGGVCSSETLAIAPLAKPNNVLVLSSLSSNPSIDGASPFVFSFSYNDNVVGQTLAKEMSRYNKIAIITEQNEYNIGVQKVVLENLKQYSNVQVVADEVFPKGATDIRSVLEKIKKAKPDAILLNPNAGITAETLIRQFSEITDWAPYKLFSQLAYMPTDVIKTAPAVLEGMTIVDSPNLTSSEMLAVKKDIEDKKGTLNDFGIYYTAAFLDNINILTDLIVELGDDPQTVRDAIATRDFKGFISDKIYFKNSSFTTVSGGIYIIKDGKPEFQQ
jgi:branched-chain amino acid transport system substrate-binding protein